ncbi:unnamed protein product [Rangifer tarandus platyrhynchus]|uniref:Uncharacterized protein n=1 Tax=Rangifer tarandus platyrhynchus TaxID=3082113 RepID=A0AC59ZVG2_RANTA
MARTALSTRRVFSSAPLAKPWGQLTENQHRQARGRLQEIRPPGALAECPRMRPVPRLAARGHHRPAARARSRRALRFRRGREGGTSGSRRRNRAASGSVCVEAEGPASSPVTLPPLSPFDALGKQLTHGSLVGRQSRQPGGGVIHHYPPPPGTGCSLSVADKAKSRSSQGPGGAR